MSTLVESVQQGPLRIPRDTYKLRVKEEPEFAVSKKQNNMLVFKLEITEPKVKKIDGVERDIAGTEFTVWAVEFKDKRDQQVNPTLENIHKACDLPYPPTMDEETGKPSGISYTGLEFWAVCTSEEVPQLNENKEPIINPANGKPLSYFQRSVDRICTP